MNPEETLDLVTSVTLEYGPKLIMAIVVWIIGSWIIKLVVRGINAVMEKGNVDASLKPFLCSLAGMGLKVMLGITVLGMLGIEMTSFIAILAADWFSSWYGIIRNITKLRWRCNDFTFQTFQGWRCN
ncbi:mechanosensitive ion channel family protein [Psychromonas sp. KJ10-10]|uniref:mechanosensitive ion channel family protein n=1 Tax=Psychromonas sp. KJ10-10 TaxID=3391823 RepID=UPI0039B4C5A5